jgi:asparagine synthase (glutamine-hydrolysing)
MCGIAGLVDPAGAPVDRALLERMNAALAPRGPDAEGIWCGALGVGLGHRRLAVIDLSPAGVQPMGSEDGAIQVVYNGEIYNFLALREELEARGYRFRSRSDTEVLVHGYDAWGDGLVDRIDGMFAFALWDGRRRRLLAARDRMGKKPFYWARVPRGQGQPPLFAFASELKALLLVPGLDRRVDPAALARYLAYEYVPAPYAIVAGARKLDAAESLVLDLGRDPAAAPVVRRYWDLPFPAAHTRRDEGEAAEELRQHLGRAVKRRLISDVPLGVFLSGGIDSSTVLALMAAENHGGAIRTFSIGFSDPSFDETSHARAVASRFGAEHQEDRLTGRSMLEVIPQVGRFLDEPLADASIIPTYLLARFTRRHVTVALGGDGGDELFAGYPTFQAERVAGRVRDALPDPVGRLATALARRGAALLPARTDYFSLDFKVNQLLRGIDARGPRRHQRWLASFLPEEIGPLLGPSAAAAGAGGWNGAGDPLRDVDARAASGPARDRWDILMDFYCRFYLAGDINVKVDRAASAVGLETRAPFLDTAVVSFACGLHPAARQDRHGGKRILKRAMRGLLPDEILDRRKQGFGVPVARWMREDLLPMVRDELHPDKLRREGYFDPSVVAEVVEEHVEGRRDHRKQLWTLLVFEQWLRNFGSGGGAG